MLHLLDALKTRCHDVKHAIAFTCISVASTRCTKNQLPPMSRTRTLLRLPVASLPCAIQAFIQRVKPRVDSIKSRTVQENSNYDQQWRNTHGYSKLQVRHARNFITF